MMVFLIVGFQLVNPVSYTLVGSSNHNNDYVGTHLLLFAYVIGFVVMAVFMFLYLTVIYPIFYNCVPSMLRHIGIGIFLCILAQLAFISIDLAENTEVANGTCSLPQSLILTLP